MSGGAAPPGLGSQRHRTSRREGRAPATSPAARRAPSWPCHRIRSGLPHSRHHSPQHIHPRFTRNRLWHNSGDNSTQHRDEQQEPGQLAPRDNSGARPTEKPQVVTFDQPASARTSPHPHARSTIVTERGEHSLSGPPPASTGADDTTVSVGGLSSVDHERDFNASAPAQIMQPLARRSCGPRCRSRFGGTARRPTHVHAVSEASWPSPMVLRRPPQDRHLHILVEQPVPSTTCRPTARVRMIRSGAMSWPRSIASATPRRRTDRDTPRAAPHRTYSRHR